MIAIEVVRNLSTIRVSWYNGLFKSYVVGWLVCGEENVQWLRRIFGGAAAVVGQSVAHVLPLLVAICFIG